jgi:hypothetical protein
MEREGGFRSGGIRKRERRRGDVWCVIIRLFEGCGPRTSTPQTFKVLYFEPDTCSDRSCTHARQKAAFLKRSVVISNFSFRMQQRVDSRQSVTSLEAELYPAHEHTAHSSSRTSSSPTPSYPSGMHYPSFHNLLEAQADHLGTTTSSRQTSSSPTPSSPPKIHYPSHYPSSSSPQPP